MNFVYLKNIIIYKLFTVEVLKSKYNYYFYVLILILINYFYYNSIKTNKALN